MARRIMKHPETKEQASNAIRKALKWAEVKAGPYPTPERWDEDCRQVADDIRQAYEGLRILVGG